jgi:transglutaminase-like putative cysteine protease
VGWIALDPTNQLVGGERHIRVALGRDYADVAPTRGVYKGEAESTLSLVDGCAGKFTVARGSATAHRDSQQAPNFQNR